ELTMGEAAKAMLIPGSGMIVGLLIAVFITYRKYRDAVPGAGGTEGTTEVAPSEKVSFSIKHALTIIAIVAALIAQIITDNLIVGALTGLILMFLFVAVPFKKGDNIVAEGVGMMGTIAFVMLVAS